MACQFILLLLLRAYTYRMKQCMLQLGHIMPWTKVHFKTMHLFSQTCTRLHKHTTEIRSAWHVYANISSRYAMKFRCSINFLPSRHLCLPISCGHYISQDITNRRRWGGKQISYVTGLICPSLNTFAGREGYARLVCASCGR